MNFKRKNTEIYPTISLTQILKGMQPELSENTKNNFKSLKKQF